MTPPTKKMKCFHIKEKNEVRLATEDEKENSNTKTNNTQVQSL